jgi:hypothetical protein
MTSIYIYIYIGIYIYIYIGTHTHTLILEYMLGCRRAKRSKSKSLAKRWWQCSRSTWQKAGRRRRRRSAWSAGTASPAGAPVGSKMTRRWRRRVTRRRRRRRMVTRRRRSRGRRRRRSRGINP